MSIPNNPHIQGAFLKAIGHLDTSKNIGISVSGGSDSDIVLDFIYQCGILDKCQVFIFDTGLEYQATWKHIDYLKDRYRIDIDRVRAKQSIPACCKKYGQPFISKNVSTLISQLQKHDFQWEDEPFEVLDEKYTGCRESLRWWTNTNKLCMKNISYNRWLKDFLIENPPSYKISPMCCKKAKKDTAKEYYLKKNLDIVVLGLRQSEGGVRSLAYDSCYSVGHPDNYRPIWWFTNEDKIEYNRFYKICNSDCYTKYGMYRTGCAGCPFNFKLHENLKTIEKYEPKLYNAVSKVFCKSIEYTDLFNQFKATKYCEEKRTKLKTPSLEVWT